MKDNKEVWVDFSNIDKNKKNYQWKTSVGKSCKFKYYELEGELKILDCNYNDKNRCILTIQYLDYKPYLIPAQDFKKYQLQYYLDTLRPDEYTYDIDSIFIDESRNLTIIDKMIKTRRYNRAGKPYDRKEECYKYHCNICGNEDWIVKYLLINGCGCNCCNGKKVVEGINDIPTTAPWMVKYFQGGYDEAKLYTKTSDKKIYPICPDCGAIKTKLMSIKTIYKNHSIGCECSEYISYPNKFSYAFLDQLPIKNREKEYSPDWMRPYSYDNYFEYQDQKYVLEMDGGLGHGNQTWEHTKDDVGLKIDRYKDNLANKHDIIVIRIDCQKSNMNYIKNNIEESLLAKIFDLSKIDWLKCDKFAIDNLIKEICIFYETNNHPKYEKIKENFPIKSNPTIKKYLEIGEKHGWCIKEKRNTKKTMLNIYDINHNFVTSHYGIIDFVKKSDEILHINVSLANLRRVLKSGKLYKGYYFEYAETN